MNKFKIEKILNIIYPPVCGICGKIDYDFLCCECKRGIEKIKKNCVETHKKSDEFYNRLFYVFKYEGLIRNKIIDYKFNDCAYLYKTFEKILINDRKICEFIKCYDIIIPVPIHKQRKKERGYNQSYLMIKGLMSKVTINSNILVKINNTQKQSTLKKEDRIENIKNAYYLDKKYYGLLENKRILIFDDIYTTGSTVNECARIINKANPNTIDIFALAKD